MKKIEINILPKNTSLAIEKVNKVICNRVGNIDNVKLDQLIDFHNSKYFDGQDIFDNLANSIASQLFLLELKLRERDKNEFIK